MEIIIGKLYKPIVVYGPKELVSQHLHLNPILTEEYANGCKTKTSPGQCLDKTLTMLSRILPFVRRW